METTLGLLTMREPAPTKTARPSSVREIYDRHGDFVWLTLQRMGVRDADLEDLAQEVYVVAHRRLSRFDGTSQITTWLFGICLRLVANYRRRAYIRRERSTPSVADVPTDGGYAMQSAEDLVAQSQARAFVEAVLATMPPAQRAVLVMFEVEELSCEAIATSTGVPVGTVYSRLHAARKAFRAGVDAMEARTSREAKEPNR